MKRNGGHDHGRLSRFGALCHAFATDGPDALDSLTRQEAVRCRSLPERRRADFRAGRLAARRAFAAFGGGLSGLRFAVRSEAGQRPRVWTPDDPRTSEARVSLSITHRDGRAAAAVCEEPFNIGIDLERTHSVARSDLTRFMGTRELAGANSLDATLLWTIKEAAWKALALPPSAPFTALELVFQEDVLRELRYGGGRWTAEAHVHSPWSGYRASLVVARPCEVT